MVLLEELLLVPILAFIGVIALQLDEKRRDTGYFAVLVGTTFLCFAFALNFNGQYQATLNPSFLDVMTGLLIYFGMGLFALILATSERFFDTIKFDGDITEIVILNLLAIGGLTALWLFGGVAGGFLLLPPASLTGALQIAIILVIAPVMEEIFFRGVLNPLVYQWMENENIVFNDVANSLILGAINMVIYAGIFMFVHGWYNFLQAPFLAYVGLFILSATTTYMVNKTQDVRASIPFHVFWNALAFSGLGVVV